MGFYQIVLAFFGLDSLESTEWIELGTGGGTAPIQQQQPKEPLAVLSSVVSARQLLQEDRDPLGINDAQFL